MNDLTDIFDRICSSGRMIVSQQRGEPDLTREENHRVLEHLYKTNPTNFTYRFGSLLTDEELKRYFDPTADFIQSITKENREKLRANRRFNHMQKLMAQGTYFSDEAMKERSPLLYEQLIEKYQQGEKRTPVLKTAQAPLTDFYMEHLESLNHHQRVEDELRREEEEDDDEEDEEDEEGEDEDKREYSKEEKDLYHQEFLAIHQGMTSFLRWDSRANFQCFFFF